MYFSIYGQDFVKGPFLWTYWSIELKLFDIIWICLKLIITFGEDWMSGSWDIFNLSWQRRSNELKFQWIFWTIDCQYKNEPTTNFRGAPQHGHSSEIFPNLNCKHEVPKNNSVVILIKLSRNCSVLVPEVIRRYLRIEFEKFGLKISYALNTYINFAPALTCFYCFV